MRPWWIKGLLLLVLVFTGAGIFAWHYWQDYQHFLAAPMNVPDEGIMILVEPGMTGQTVIRQLDQEGISRSDWRWRLLMKLNPVVVKVGEYSLTPGITPVELLRKLESGDVVQHRFTIVEGWTFRQLLLALNQEPLLESEWPFWSLSPELPAGKNALDGGANQVEYRKPPGPDWSDALQSWLRSQDPPIEHPEGWFMPETYVYTRGDSATDILSRAYRAAQQAVAAAWTSRDENLPLDSPYELLILASIIEKETALESEREEISGVFIRRLQQGMRLQTDPTIIYGMGDTFDGDIRRKDLKTDTPYNTYTRFGLPPTPIALPGKASLEAAAHPASGTALFFVADGKGGHTFSDTLEQHQKAVNQLIRQR